MINLTWGMNTVELKKKAHQVFTSGGFSTGTTSTELLVSFYRCPLRAHWLTLACLCVFGSPGAELSRERHSRGVIKVAQKMLGFPHPTPPQSIPTVAIRQKMQVLYTQTQTEKSFSPTAINALEAGMFLAQFIVLKDKFGILN